VEEDLAGESVVAQMQWRKLARHLEDVSIAAESVEQDSAGGDASSGAGRLRAGISRR
jgi:hypothetical protein